MNIPKHTIKLHGEAEAVEDLEVEEVIEGTYEKGVLVLGGGVRFRTPARKLFFLTFDQFSFVFPARKAGAS